MTVFVNGRFLTQPLSGVQRYAVEILGALDRRLFADPAALARLGGVEVLVPRPVSAPDWRTLQLRVVRGGGGHLWEQVALAQASHDGVLFGPGGSGPLCHRRQVLVLHDAHVWDHPEGFSATYRHWHRALRPRLAQRAAALLTVSRDAATRLAPRLGVSESRFRIVPNGVGHLLRLPAEAGTVTRAGLSSGGYWLTVGNLAPVKNLPALIAAHAVAGPDMPVLAVVGATAPGLATIRAVPSDRVRCLGRVADGALRALYEGAAGFVFPSLSEGFGIPPLEAMQVGLPVLAARRGALPEVLGSAALWFDPGDPADMVAALRNFAALDAGTRARLSVAGRARAASFTWEQSAEHLLEILAATAETRRAAA